MTTIVTTEENGIDLVQQNGHAEEPKRTRKPHAIPLPKAAPHTSNETVQDALSAFTEARHKLLADLSSRRTYHAAQLEEIDNALASIGGESRTFFDVEANASPSRTAVPKPTRKPRTPSATPRTRISAADIQDTVAAVVALISKHEAGIGAQAIREELALDKVLIVKAIKTALEAGTIRSEGERRNTVYHLASE